MSFDNLPIEIVEWIDHHSNRGAHTEFTVVQLQRVSRIKCLNRTVGYVVDETDDQVTLASEQRADSNFEEPLYSETLTIMTALIVSRTVLEAKR